MQPRSAIVTSFPMRLLAAGHDPRHTSFSVGFDHIDLAAAKSRGIIVTNTPEVLNDATAEIAMLLLLGAARRAYEGARETRDAMGFGALDNLDAIMSRREPLDRLV